ncbi:MAG: nucleotidyltransferase domain-containing protein [Clostridia bacterium]|nr:nucleotidyltransferase domain-containing protein [Clostridia bacterium]
MFKPDIYISDLIAFLKPALGERLVYVGLQGSYLRGEATQSSDIDVMTVIRDITPADLDVYRSAIQSLGNAEQSCGFICGQDELLHWNPLEICHLLHTTEDHLGTLASLVPAYTREDVRAYVKISVSNLCHEICHRYVHATPERNAQALPGTYKGVFFILQNLHWLRTGCFIGTKAALLAALDGPDRQVLEASLALSSGAAACDFDAAFALLLSWCRETLLNT